MRGGRFLGVLIACAFAVAACGSGGTTADGSAVASGGASAPVSEAASAAASAGPTIGDVTVTQDEAAAVEQVIGPDGGSITAKATDGTTFVLTVPLGAMSSETRVTATPATLGGLDFPTYTVMFEPTGTQFMDWATLVITPASDVPLPDQFMYQLNDAATEFGGAFMDPKAEAPTILLDHFSGYGLAQATEPDRAAMLSKGASDAEARIQSEFASILGKERQAQLLGGDLDASLADSFEKYSKEYEEQVIKPRLEAAGGSCEATTAAVGAVLRYERQRQLLGLESSSNVDASQILQDALNATDGPCEKEAIRKCKAARDPGILIAFWLDIERSRQLLGSQGAEFDVNSMIKKARAICAPSAYDADGQLPSAPSGIVMKGHICSLAEPFSVRLSGDLVGRMKFTPTSEEAGTWTFSGRLTAVPWGSDGSGSYTVSSDGAGLATSLDFEFVNTTHSPLGSKTGSGPGTIALTATAPCAEQQ